MTKKLSDVQLILLSTAHQRADGNLLPPAEAIARHGLRLRSSINHLISRGLVEEHRTERSCDVWREDDQGRIGVRLTAEGQRVIGHERDQSDVSEKEQGTGSTTTHAAASAFPPTRRKVAAGRTGTKQALLLELLGREDGATLTELMSATGWLQHSTRAALTGLRKKGYVVQRVTGEAGARYSLARAGHSK